MHLTVQFLLHPDSVHRTDLHALPTPGTLFRVDGGLPLLGIPQNRSVSSIAAGTETVATADALVKVDVLMRMRRDQLFLPLDVLQRFTNDIQR